MDMLLFAEKAAGLLQERNVIEAAVVFGSVARGEEREDSDIDLLVIVREKSEGEKVRKVLADIEEREGHRVHFSPLLLTREEAAKRVTPKEYFWRDILEQGVIVYDSGIYSRIREKAFGKSRAVPVGR